MSEPKNTSTPVALEAREIEEGRLFSSSAGRNQLDIARALAEVLPQNASVLEVGSGTGEHGIATLSLRSDLTWQFSDPDPASRASQAAWITHHSRETETAEQAKPLNIDATTPDWAASLNAKYDVIFASNMIHIAPIDALNGLARQAEIALNSNGIVILYGPFLFEGASAPSNLHFDGVLRSKNSAWGVRELGLVKHIFAKNGFNHVELRDMPKNNHIIGLSRL